MTKRDYPNFVDLISKSCFVIGICIHFLALSTASKTSRKLSTEKPSHYFANFQFLLEDKTLMCLQFAKLEQFVCKGHFVGTFAHWCFSMLGLKNCQKN